MRIFLAEKGIEVPYRGTRPREGRLKTPEFTKLNRFQRVPVLVLDDGTSISETMAICRYFEETKPEPALFGKGAKQRAMVEMWNRRMELGLLFCVAQASATCTRPWPSSRCRRSAAWGEANKPRALECCRFLDEELGKRRFIAGDELFGSRHYRAGGGRFHEAGADGTAGRPENLARWHEEVSARPSAKA